MVENSMSEEDRKSLWHPDSREQAVNKIEREWAAKQIEVPEHDMSKLGIQETGTISGGQNLVKAQLGREL